MKEIVRNKTRYPTSVPVIIGTPALLVAKRTTVGKFVTKPGAAGYETNHEIKCWATWYLLKALTTTGCIEDWRKQKDFLLPWVQMTENSFRQQLSWLREKKLVFVEKNTRSIRLTSYRNAAKILGISYSGTYTIDYDPQKHLGKQTFRYFLTAEEFVHHQSRQAAAIVRKLKENRTLHEHLITLLIRYGCDLDRLKVDSAYFIERLLQFQIQLFKQGSANLSFVFDIRADINRSVRKIRKDHGYKATQSVSYLKKQMALCGIAQITKKSVESVTRSRIYIPSDAGAGFRDGYKWIPFTKKTVLFLCDQVKMLYKTGKS